MSNNTLPHVRPTEWFLGQCENTGCENRSVKWSDKSQQFLCWSCVAPAEYKTIAGLVNG